MVEQSLTIPEPEPAVSPPPRRAPRRRLWVFILLLIVAAASAWFSRDWLARIPNALARRSIASRDLERAAGWLAWSRRISPENAEAEFLRARISRREGQMTDTRRHIKQALDWGWSAEQLDREQWLALAQAGQMQQAQPKLAELLANASEDGAEVCEAYVIGALRMRQLGLVEALLEAWTRDYPLDAQPHFWRALMNKEIDKPDEAERNLRYALELNPRHREAALVLAEVLYLDRKLAAEALPYYERATESAKNRTAATLGLARCLRTLGRQPEAESALTKRLAEAPGDQELTIELANSYIERGNYEPALKMLEPLVTRDSRNRELRYAYGVALRSVGRGSEAEPHLAYAAEAGREFDRIQVLTHQAIGQPQNAEIRYEIGRSLLKYGVYKEAIVWLESALQCDPMHKEAHRLLADYYGEKASEGDVEYARLATLHRQLAELGP